MDHQPTQQEIALRAYAMWEREGHPQNRSLDHWFAAERELTQAVPTSPTLSADIPIKPARRVAKSSSKIATPKAAKAKPRTRTGKPAAKDLH